MTDHGNSDLITDNSRVSRIKALMKYGQMSSADLDVASQQSKPLRNQKPQQQTQHFIPVNYGPTSAMQFNYPKYQFFNYCRGLEYNIDRLL
jgi:hypothetical protein